MEEIILFLLQHGENLQQTQIRVRQIIPYLLEDIVGVKNALPAKVFTEKYSTVKYPRCVVSKKSYSNFGLEMEALVLWRLSKLYASKFVGASEINPETLPTLTDRDRETYSPQILESLDEISNYFEKNFPPRTVHQVVANSEFVHTTISGHPDLVVWLSTKKVVIFDVKVFAKMNLSKSREIKAQLALYVTLARNQGLECDKTGVIMPWSRDPAVVTYEVKKWDSTPLIKTAEVCAQKVRDEPSKRAKWNNLLRRYNVGSHILKNHALSFLRSGIIDTPFQIFLYGNNPSPQMESKGKEEWKKIAKKAFEPYNAFVHAPYNLNLALEEEYVVSAAQMYLEESAFFGFKGVVFHVGHHSNSEEGVAIMERNMAKILEYSRPETPFILETPCGNKNELLSSPEEFREFILRFPEQLLGICLDTCHVFVSGYMPTEYIDRLDDASDRICLFHFNGSRKKKGCRADGHGHVTRVQNIPDDELEKVLGNAKEWGICSVTE